MSQALEFAASSIASLRDSVAGEEQRRTDLHRANEGLHTELEGARSKLMATKEELGRLEDRLEEMKRTLLVDGLDNGIISFDVGGQLFKMHRSTLAQFPDSMLATMTSSRWTESFLQEQGSNSTLFLDMDPDNFGEIVAFLRRRRLNLNLKSNFSCEATAELASYLGIPVDYVRNSQSKTVVLERMGDKHCRGIAFSIVLPHPTCGKVTGIGLSLTEAAECQCYTKPGGYADALGDASLWTLAWDGSLQAGFNQVPLSIELQNGREWSIYIWLDCRSTWWPAPLFYSNNPPRGDQMLTVSPGRSFHGDAKRFSWPPDNRQAYPETADQWFVGEIEFSLFAQQQL